MQRLLDFTVDIFLSGTRALNCGQVNRECRSVLHMAHMEGEDSGVLAVKEVIGLFAPFFGWLSTRGKYFFTSLAEASEACALRFKNSSNFP